MDKRLKEFRSRFRRTTLRWLWREWSALGVAGATARETRNAIDPEALLLFTGTLGRSDPRLFDEVVDWLAAHGRLLNGPRLKRLLREYELESGQVVAAACQVLAARGRRLDWKMEPAGAAAEEPLFQDEEGRPLPDFGARDPDFLAQGFRRGRLELRQYSQPPDPANPACLWLTLRALFGISCRVEIMLYLVSRTSGHPSQIARDVGYTQRNVQDVMVNMAASGQLRATRKGREVEYRLASPLWHRLLLADQAPPKWLLWPAVFRALEQVWLWLSAEKTEALAGNVLASELFLLVRRIRPWLERADLAHGLAPESQGVGADYVAAFIRDMDLLLALAGMETGDAENEPAPM